MNKMLNGSWGRFYAFLLPPVIGILLFSLALGLVSKDMESKQEPSKAENPTISETDTLKVTNYTHDFFSTFSKGNPLSEQIFTDLTFKYFKSDYIENDFTATKEMLFGLYGFQKLTNTFTTLEGLKDEGGIESFEIEDIQRDNANQTITVYVRMDVYEPNKLHWIEWRNIPGEGWKINALSFDGNIDSLENFISPKKEMLNSQ